MKNLLALCGTALFLTSCAYVVDEQIQDITFKTEAAEDAVCYAYINDLKFRIYPPATVTLPNSRNDMIVDCLAPGNRRKKMAVPAELNDSFAGNLVSWGVPGAGWDMASGAAWGYPDIIYIDFTGMELIPESLPQHNNPDIRQPEEYLLEEFRPGSPRMNSELQEGVATETTVITDDSFIVENPNPRGKGSDDAPYSGAVPLYPGN